MADSYQVGERVQVYLDEKFGEREGWYTGIVARIEPYSQHRSFYWVRLDPNAQTILRMVEISVFMDHHMISLLKQLMILLKPCLFPDQVEIIAQVLVL